MSFPKWYLNVDLHGYCPRVGLSCVSFLSHTCRCLHLSMFLGLHTWWREESHPMGKPVSPPALLGINPSTPEAPELEHQPSFSTMWPRENSSWLSWGRRRLWCSKSLLPCPLWLFFEIPKGHWYFFAVACFQMNNSIIRIFKRFWFCTDMKILER